jgi:D-xylonolactonase
MIMPIEYLKTTERLQLGEGPLWHPTWHELLVVDVHRGEIHRFDPGLTRVGTIAVGRPTSAVTWQSDGSIICFHDKGIVSRIAHAQAQPETILTVTDESSGMFNDVIADRQGRVLCGALPIGDRPGRLYSVARDGSYRILLDDLLEPNGMGFSADGTVLYFADSVGQTIWRFLYDQTTGELAERTVLHRTRGDELPDGLTIDSDGRILCALWGGSGLIRLSAAGTLIDRVPVPAKHVTSLAFGGSELRELYVPSALSEGAGEPTEGAAGAVYRLSGVGQGRPEWPSRLLV